MKKIFILPFFTTFLILSCSKPSTPVTSSTTSQSSNSSSSTSSNTTDTTTTSSSTQEHTHTYSSEWSYDQTYHYHSPLCDDTNEVMDKEEHTFESTTIKEATNDEDGLIRSTCNVCGYSKEEIVPYVPSSPKASNKNLNKEYDSIDNAIKYATNDDSIVIYPSLEAKLNEKTTIPQTVQVYLPFKDEMILARGSNKSTTDLTQFTNTTKLTLNADLIIEGSLTIGGTINTLEHPYQGFIQGDYGSLDLNGHNITIQNGGKIISNGLIYDSSINKGSITIKENSSLSTSFAIEDFRGGTNSLNKYNNGESPFNLYRLPYLQVDTKVDYNAYLNANCVLYALEQHNSVSETIIGKNGLLEIVEEDGYIIRKYDDANGYKATMEIYGDAINNAMSILSVTTENVFFPITKYLDIEVYDDSVLTVQNKLKVLPGSTITLHDNSKINLNGQVILYQTYRPQSDFTTADNYTFYADYGTYDAAKLMLLDNSDLSINTKNIDNKLVSLGGNIYINSANEHKIKATLLNSNNYYSEIKSREGIGWRSYHLLYEQEENINIYTNVNNSYRLTNKRFKNFSFTYNYNSSSNIDFIIMQNIDGSFVGYKDYSLETPQWKIKIDGTLTNSSFTSETLDAILSENSKTYIFYNGNYVEGTLTENKTYVIDGEIYIDYEGFYLKVENLENGIYYDKNNNHYIYLNGWTKIYDILYSNKMIAIESTDYPDELDFCTFYFYKDNSIWTKCSSYSIDYKYFSYYDSTEKTSYYYIYYNDEFIKVNNEISMFGEGYTSDGTNHYLRINIDDQVEWVTTSAESIDKKEMIFEYQGDKFLSIGSEYNLNKVKEIKEINGFKYAVLENPVTKTIKYSFNKEKTDLNGKNTFDSIEKEYKIAVQEYDYSGEDNSSKWNYASIEINHYDSYGDYYEGNTIFTFDSSGREFAVIPIKSDNRCIFTYPNGIDENSFQKDGSVYYKSNPRRSIYKLAKKSNELLSITELNITIPMYDSTNSSTYFLYNNNYIAGDFIFTGSYSYAVKSTSDEIYCGESISPTLTGQNKYTYLGTPDGYSYGEYVIYNPTTMKGVYSTTQNYSGVEYTVLLCFVEEDSNGYLEAKFFAKQGNKLDPTELIDSTTHTISSLSYKGTTTYIIYNGYLVSGIYDSNTSKFTSSDETRTFAYDSTTSSWVLE